MTEPRFEPYESHAAIRAERDRLRWALERVLRTIDPQPAMPRPRDAVRDQVRQIVTDALNQNDS